MSQEVNDNNRGPPRGTRCVPFPADQTRTTGRQGRQPQVITKEGFVEPPDQGVYGISMAAQLAGMGIQRLRLYESRGLLSPDRTAGGTRRYSRDDLGRLQRIDALLRAGLNLAGIAMVLDLQDENQRLHQRLDQ